MITASEMGKRSQRKQKKNPNYSAMQREKGRVPNERKKKLAIYRAVAYLRANGYTVIKNVIKPKE